MKNQITIGTRSSRLALAQTGRVVARLNALYPHLKFNVVKIATTGDKDRRTGLEELGTAVFVKELEDALLEERIDLAVHSLKDVPAELPRGLELLAVTERVDPRDVLVANTELMNLPAGARIGTDSLRRTAQLAQVRPDLQVCSLRGNIDTRLRKVASAEVDGIILAAAGLLRLGRQDRISQYLSLADFLPAVGQGALVVEGRAADEDAAELVTSLNDWSAWQCSLAERSFLLTLGGGCRAPIAALATVNGDEIKLAGMVGSPDGSQMLRESVFGNINQPRETGIDLARQLLRRGAQRVIAGGLA